MSSSLRSPTCAVLALALVAAALCRAPFAAAEPAVAAGVIKGGEHGWPVFLAFSPDGKELARLCVWGHVLLDTATFKKGRVFDVGIRMLAYSPDGKQMATAEGTDGARLWNAAAKGTAVPNDAQLQRELQVLSKPDHVLLTPAQAHAQRVFATGFAADGASLFTTDAAGHVKIWQSKTGALLADINPPGAGAVSSAAFDPSGKRIAFGDDRGVLRIWDLEKKALRRETQTPMGAIIGTTYSPDGKRLATSHAQAVMIWDPNSGKARVEDGYHTAAFSPDGRMLALGGEDVRLLTPATGALLRGVVLAQLSTRDAMSVVPPNTPSQQKLPTTVQALAWSHDSQLLAVGCMDSTVRLVNTK